MNAAPRFRALADLIEATRSYWDWSPFGATDCPWASRAPELYGRVQALSDADAEHLMGDDDALLRWLAGAGLTEAAGLAEQIRVPVLADVHSPAKAETDPRAWAGIPGRKQAQIRAFLQALPPRNGVALEWCAGKGHLIRVVSRTTQRPGIGLELQPDLVVTGQALADAQGVAVSLQPCDVLRDEQRIRQTLSQTETALALHACGELHRSLVRQVIAQRVPEVVLAPCCYHLHGGGEYVPLSRAGAAACLRLSRDQLRHAVRQTRTAPPRVRRQQHALNIWRLAFDAWVREALGIDHYTALPPRPLSVLQDGFEAFCQWGARHHGLALPAMQDGAHWLDAGRKR
ncbi:MAG: methyltransferase, partial [Gammaproteobacteria bacterium]